MAGHQKVKTVYGGEILTFKLSFVRVNSDQNNTAVSINMLSVYESFLVVGFGEITILMKSKISEPCLE